MRSKAFGFLAAGLGLVFAAAPVLAHHSFAAEYDRERPIKFTGTVTKVEWMNPHIYYYVDVKESNGNVKSYSVEGGTPNQLRRQGWGKDSLKVGEVVTVEGFSARKAEAHTINGRTVTLADGRRVFGFSGPADTANQ